MKVAYYPGCSGEGTSKEYEVSTRAICDALDIQVQEIEDWSCCGSTPGHSMDPLLSGALSARNLSLASKMDTDCVATPCPSCLSNLKHAKHRMENEEFRAKVDELLDEPTTELPEIYSVLQVIVDNISMEDIAKKVVKPLTGLKVATYYGCLMVRPAGLMNFDDCENPVSLDNLLTALGAEVVPFPLKTECCGASMGVVDSKVTGKLSGRILERAKEFGAHAVVTACPLCQMNLDLRQFQAEDYMGQKFNMPIFYYTQLLGLALGLGEDKLLMKKLVVSPAEVLENMEKAQAELARAAEEKAKADAEKAAAKAKADAEKAAKAAAKAAETKKDEGAA